MSQSKDHANSQQYLNYDRDTLITNPQVINLYLFYFLNFAIFFTNCGLFSTSLSLGIYANGFKNAFIMEYDKGTTMSSRIVVIK